MCGITGFINLDGRPAVLDVLKRMTDAIAHRGPDGEGHVVEGSVAIGHRRLAVIDLSPAADQPFLSADGTNAIVYNGEIYNYRELRAQLEKKQEILKAKKQDIKKKEHLMRRDRNSFASSDPDLGE